MPHWLATLQAVVGVVMTIWGVIALVAGPILVLKFRTYFPERREAVTPDQLREQLSLTDDSLREHLASVDFSLRETMQKETLGLGARVTECRLEILAAVRSVEDRTEQALNQSRDALHKAELLEQRHEGEYKLLLEKMDHQRTALNTLQTFLDRIQPPHFGGSAKHG